MKCTLCKNKAVFLKPTYCKKHFCAYIENKVHRTINQYKLITKKDNIVVACSGGKDSLTILSLLKKYDIIALCIDEGIQKYREHTIKDMVRFCTKHNIRYRIVSYKKEFGMPLDDMLVKLKEKPCTVCGAFRRYLLNKTARSLKATKLVTGHNMDDEAQAVLMNLFKHQTSMLPRLGPITGVINNKKFIPRVKPLYFLTEKEIAAYAFFQDFGIRFTECPNASQAYRAEIGALLNDIEQDYPGSKKNLIMHFIRTLPTLKQARQQEEIAYCNQCSELCMQELCKVCQYVKQLEVLA